jgi:hypothetical protein
MKLLSTVKELKTQKKRIVEKLLESERDKELLSMANEEMRTIASTNLTKISSNENQLMKLYDLLVNQKEMIQSYQGGGGSLTNSSYNSPYLLPSSLSPSPFTKAPVVAVLRPGDFETNSNLPRTLSNQRQFSNNSNNNNNFHSYNGTNNNNNNLAEVQSHNSSVTTIDNNSHNYTSNNHTNNNNYPLQNSITDGNNYNHNMNKSNDNHSVRSMNGSFSGSSDHDRRQRELSRIDEREGGGGGKRPELSMDSSFSDSADSFSLHNNQHFLVPFGRRNQPQHPPPSQQPQHQQYPINPINLSAENQLINNSRHQSNNNNNNNSLSRRRPGPETNFSLSRIEEVNDSHYHHSDEDNNGSNTNPDQTHQHHHHPQHHDQQQQHEFSLNSSHELEKHYELTLEKLAHYDLR